MIKEKRKIELEKLLNTKGIFLGKKKISPNGSQNITMEDILTSDDFTAGIIHNYAFSKESGYPSSNYSIILANLKDNSACRVTEYCVHAYPNHEVPKLKKLESNEIITLHWDYISGWGRGKITSSGRAEYIYNKGRFGVLSSNEILIKPYEKLSFYP